MENKGLIIFILVMVVGFAVVFYLMFLSGTKCENLDCYETLMGSCKKGSYINEESEASWGYKVKGKSGDLCEIEVTLLQAKEGDLSLRDFEDDKMTCFYDTGVAVFPEKDLSRCTGLLKEDIQGVLIEKLYSHILDNLGEIAEGLR